MFCRSIFNLKFLSIAALIAGTQYCVAAASPSPAQIIKCTVLGKHKDVFNSAVFSPDGRLIVTASNDHTACVWNATTGILIHKLIGHTDAVNSAKFSPDGRFIVTASRDRTACVWNATTGVLIHRLIGHTSNVYSAVFSPDGNLIATVDSDARIWDGHSRIWNAATGVLMYSLDGFSISPVFSPDSRCIVTAGLALVYVWSTTTGVKFMEGHVDRADSIVFSPDGNFIAATKALNKTHIWNVKTGTLIHELDNNTSLARLIGTLNNPTHLAMFSPNGRCMVSYSTNGIARIWDVKTGILLRALDFFSSLDEQTVPIEITPNCRFILAASYVLATSHRNNLMTTKPFSIIYILDTTTGSLAHALASNSGPVRSAKFSSNGRSIVTASDDGTVHIWRDTRTQAQILAITCGAQHPRLGENSPVRLIGGDKFLMQYIANFVDSDSFSADTTAKKSSCAVM